MSNQEQQQAEQEQQPKQQAAQSQPLIQQQQNQQQQHRTELSEEDKKIYENIMGSLNMIQKKIRDAKQKYPSRQVQKEQKINLVNQIAEKLIESKENSDIINKEDLIKDVQQTYEQVVINVYTQNKQMKKRINSLIAIIKQQNKIINFHKEKQNKLRYQNQQLREQAIKLKDQLLTANLHSTGGYKKIVNVNKGNSIITKNKSIKNKISHVGDNEDYDFWNMPNNDSEVIRKRKQFQSDSKLWVNDKNIDKSIFSSNYKNNH